MPPSLEHKSRGNKELERGPGGSVSDSGTPASGSAALHLGGLVLVVGGVAMSEYLNV